MTDFLLPEGQARDITTRLAQLPGFRASAEYRGLRAYERDIPGVVCGAFADYLIRLYSGAGLGSPQGDEDIRVAQHALNALATSTESSVRNIVTDEIFEKLADAPQRAKIETGLMAEASAFYKEWLARQP